MKKLAVLRENSTPLFMFSVTARGRGTFSLPCSPPRVRSADYNLFFGGKEEHEKAIIGNALGAVYGTGAITHDSVGGRFGIYHRKRRTYQV